MTVPGQRGCGKGNRVKHLYGALAAYALPYAMSGTHIAYGALASYALAMPCTRRRGAVDLYGIACRTSWYHTLPSLRYKQSACSTDNLPHLTYLPTPALCNVQYRPRLPYAMSGTELANRIRAHVTPLQRCNHGGADRGMPGAGASYTSTRNTPRNQTQATAISVHFVPGMRFLVFDLGCRRHDKTI
eukprot:3006425-Rhodomonas_salina.1